jgi:hypothetical protein
LSCLICCGLLFYSVDLALHHFHHRKPTASSTLTPTPAILSVQQQMGTQINQLIHKNPQLQIGVAVFDPLYGLYKVYGVSTPFTAASIQNYWLVRCFYMRLSKAKRVSIQRLVRARQAGSYRR